MRCGFATLTVAPEIGECVSARVTVPRIEPWAAAVEPLSATAAVATKEQQNHGVLTRLLSMRISPERLEFDGVGPSRFNGATTRNSWTSLANHE
jgi:hypothetical protein